jgi:multiple sugar transport system ATP-binding protein
MTAEGASIALPPAIAQALAGSEGRPITVGVRPEDLTLSPAGSAASIEGTVEVREPLGNEVLLHWQTPVGELVSRVPGQEAPPVGERTRLHVAYEKLHFFDPETEQALGRSTEPILARSS